MTCRTSAVIAVGLAVAAGSGCAPAGRGAGGPGAPRSATPATGAGVLQGHLFGVGGPAPGLREPWAGTVTVSGQGRHRDLAVAADGFYSVVLAPGRYTVTGRSPRFGDGRQPCAAASAGAEVTAGLVRTLDVFCQVK
jgi:hypothetical protein